MERYGHVLVKAFTERVDGPGLEAIVVNYKALHKQVMSFGTTQRHCAYICNVVQGNQYHTVNSAEACWRFVYYTLRCCNSIPGKKKLLYKVAIAYNKCKQPRPSFPASGTICRSAGAGDTVNTRETMIHGIVCAKTFV